jgi:hypothetical protein
MVFVARGDQHLRFLLAEVIPAAVARGIRVAVCDPAADRLAVAHRREIGWHGLDHFGEICAGLGVDSAAIPAALARLRHGPLEPFERHVFGLDPRPVSRAAVQRLEDHPLRLWEALFWRGHSYRYEIIEGAVPLVADMLSRLAANRTLLSLVRDAERLEARAASEGEGWIRCGRFRMRQLDTLVELRVHLSEADIRAAFAPRTRVPEDEREPTIVGTLLAGGDNGKTELVHGWTWSTIELPSEEHAGRIAELIASEIRAWTDQAAAVIGRDAELPEEHSPTWFVCAHGRWLTVYVPMARHDCLPFDVVIGGHEL